MMDQQGQEADSLASVPIGPTSSTALAALRAENVLLRAQLATLRASQAEQRRLEQELAESHEVVERMLRHVVHELRTPMTSIKAGLQLGLRRLDRLMATGQPIQPHQLLPMREVLDIARRQLDTENELVIRMLQAARQGERLPNVSDLGPH